MVDRERNIKSLRRDLEGWREVLVTLHSILIWEKQFYPAITSSIISFVFLIIWYIDPAVLTLISFIGIIITLCDFLVPQVTPFIYARDSWTGNHERKYENIIVTLASMFEKCSGFASSLHSVKSSKPKTFFVVVLGCFLLSAWVGSSVNNFFLTYLIVLLAALYPGLRRQVVVKKYFALIMQNISKMLKGNPTAGKDSDDKETKKE